MEARIKHISPTELGVAVPELDFFKTYTEADALMADMLWLSAYVTSKETKEDA